MQQVNRALREGVTRRGMVIWGRKLLLRSWGNHNPSGTGCIQHIWGLRRPARLWDFGWKEKWHEANQWAKDRWWEVLNYGWETHENGRYRDFPGSPVDCKEVWAPKNWCLWTVLLEKTLENPCDCKEIKPINPKGNQPWIFIGRTGAEAEAPISHLIETANSLKMSLMLGKDWRQREKGLAEGEMVRQHHRLNGHESEQTPGDSEGQGSLVCCSPWPTKSQTWISNWTITTTSG